MNSYPVASAVALERVLPQSRAEKLLSVPKFGCTCRHFGLIVSRRSRKPEQRGLSMRRITAVGLSALALCGVIVTTAGTASADATGRQKYAASASTSSSRAVTPPPAIGKKHHFHYAITGSDVSGVWYWAKINGKSEIWLYTQVRDTKSDGKSAAFCAALTKGSICRVTTKGKGSIAYTSGGIDPKGHFTVMAAVGRVDAKKNIFYISAHGAWHKIR
jgi:hypothetical protein